MPCKIKSGKAAKLSALKIMKLDGEENPFSLPRAVGLLFVQHLFPVGSGGREVLPINPPFSAT